ncbi:MAG: hypothetical protein ABI910_03435 [Gemmatimonadota bacterium]
MANCLLPTVVLPQDWRARLLGNDAVPATDSRATGMSIVSLSDSVLAVRVSWDGLTNFPEGMCVFSEAPPTAANRDHLAFCLRDPIAPDPAQQGSQLYRVNLYATQTFPERFLRQYHMSMPDVRGALLEALRSGTAYVAIFT